MKAPPSCSVRWQWARLEELSVRELYAAIALRQRVFVVEQQCAYLDADGLDLEAWHLIGWQDEALRAYLRALPPAAGDDAIAISRVVTAPEARGEGLGRQLMQEGMRRAREAFGTRPILLSAQARLERFYRGLGFEVTGPGYLEDGIPHLPMRTH